MQPTTAPIDRSAAWEHAAAALRDQPAVWHLVRTCRTRGAAKTLARDIRRGAIAAFRPAGHYTASCEGCDVKACYQPSE